MLLKLHGDSSDIRVRSFVCPTEKTQEGRIKMSFYTITKILLVVSTIFMFHFIYGDNPSHWLIFFNIFSRWLKPPTSKRPNKLIRNSFGGFKHFFWLSHQYWGMIIPTGWLIFFRGVRYTNHQASKNKVLVWGCLGVMWLQVKIMLPRSAVAATEKVCPIQRIFIHSPMSK